MDIYLLEAYIKLFIQYWEANFPILPFLTGVASVAHYFISEDPNKYSKGKVIGLFFYGFSVNYIVYNFLFGLYHNDALAVMVGFIIGVTGTDGYKLFIDVLQVLRKVVTTLLTGTFSKNKLLLILRPILKEILKDSDETNKK